MNIKPIETQYKGYRFRSRLEARWAVFFDALSVPWEYEKEGYDLGEAGWYLPDFWLPSHQAWIEIKPDRVGGKVLHDDYWSLMYCFSESLNTSIIAVVGLPGSAQFYLFRNGHLLGAYNDLAPCRYCKKAYWLANDRDSRTVGSNHTHPKCGEKWSAMPPDESMKKAIRAALSARFEYGETPR